MPHFHLFLKTYSTPKASLSVPYILVPVYLALMRQKFGDENSRDESSGDEVSSDEMSSDEVSDYLSFDSILNSYFS